MKGYTGHHQGLGTLAAFLGGLLAVAAIAIFLFSGILNSYLPAEWQDFVPAAYAALARALALVSLAVGVYCVAWGVSLVAQAPWGVYGAVLSLGLTIIYVLVGGYLWLVRWAPLFAAAGAELQQIRLYGAVVAGLLLVALLLTIRKLWLATALDAYAANYSYKRARPHPGFCQRHGFILEDGICPECATVKVFLELALPDNPDHPHKVPVAPEKPQLFIGRDAANDIVLDGAVLADYSSVSSRHAELRYDFERDYLIVIDHGSTNGTYLDGQRLVSGKFSPPITENAQLRLGGVEIELRVRRDFPEVG